MFGSRKKINDLNALVDRLADSNEKLIKTCEDFTKFAFLISVEREGRTNKFMFKRGEELYVVETMGLIGDNLKEWKEKLIR